MSGKLRTRLALLDERTAMQRANGFSRSSLSHREIEVLVDIARAAIVVADSNGNDGLRTLMAVIARWDT